MTPKLRKQLREEAGDRCDICRRIRSDIHIHHRDRNRKNEDPSNLQVLCQRCHVSVHKGLTWSDELGDFDTPIARRDAAIAKRIAEGQKQSLVITVDVAVYEKWQRMAQSFGRDGDIGRLLTESEFRDHTSFYLGQNFQMDGKAVAA